MRVLLIAENCNPEAASVPLVGWSLFNALRQREDLEVHLVTQVRNHEAILRAGLVEGDDFTTIDTDGLMKPVNRLISKVRGGEGRGWTIVQALLSLSYPYFERRVWQLFGDRIDAGEFDVVHRSIPLTPVAPSPIAKKCRRAGVPFIYGPINGGLPWPKGFEDVQAREGEWLSKLRPAYKLMPGLRSTRRNAHTIIVGSRHTWVDLPRKYRSKCVHLPENSIDPTKFPTPPDRPRPPSRPLKGVYLGRLVPLKAVDLLVEASIELARRGDLELDIIGWGTDEQSITKMVEDAGVADRIRMRGGMPHEEVHRELAKADIFTFPSIRDFGGAVVLEAMSQGVVPVVVHYGGPGELVSDESGFRIPISGRDELVASMRAQLEALCADPTSIAPKRQAAIERVDRLYTWEAKAQQVRDVYESVVSGSPRPDFGFGVDLTDGA